MKESYPHSQELNNPISFNDLDRHLATSGVYAIHCMATNTYYIGQSQVVSKRVMDHISFLDAERHQNTKLQKDYNEFGKDSFVVDIVADMPDSHEQERLKQETKIIQRYKSLKIKLYNMVLSSAIRTTEPTYGGTVHRYQNQAKQKKRKPQEQDISAYVYTPYVSADRTPVTCVDCGVVGVMFEHIFECDDKKMRCTKCIEASLESWRMKFENKKSTVILRPSKKSQSFFRWLMDDRRTFAQNMNSAFARFTEKHGYIPENVYVNPEYQCKSKFDGIAILRRNDTPRNYLDIQIPAAAL